MNVHRALRAARLLLILALALAALPWAVTLIAGLGAARDSLIPAHRATAGAIARSLTAQVERALAVGIPLGEMQGMPAFLDDYLAEHAELRYLVITDSGWHVLYEREPAGAPAVTLAGAPPPSSVDLPLTIGKDEVGHVLVGFTQAAIGGDLARLARALVLGFLVGGWIVLEIVRYLAGVRIVEPVRMIAGILADGATGDFRRAARPGGGGELGATMTLLGRLTRHLMRRRSELIGRAEDAKGDAYEAGFAADVDMIVGGALAGLAIADDRPRLDEPRIERPLRRLLLVLIGAAIALPLAILVGAEPSSPAALFGPVAIFAAAFLVAGRTLDVVRRLLGRPLAITLGMLAAGIGTVLLDPMFSPGTVLFGAGLAGIGAALMLHATTEIYGIPAGEAGIQWDVDALCGFAAGIGIAAACWLAIGGSVIAGFLPYMPIGLLLCAAILGGLAMPEGAHETDADGLLALGELVATMTRLPVLVMQLGIAAPATALLATAAVATLRAADIGMASLAWAIAATIGASLGLFCLGGPREQLAVQLVRLAGAVSLVVATSHLLADGWSALLIAFFGGGTLVASALSCQWVASAERGILGRKRVLLAARIGRALGIMVPLAAAAAGVPTLTLMALVALWLVIGSLVAWLVPEVAGRATPSVPGRRQAAG